LPTDSGAGGLARRAWSGRVAAASAPGSQGEKLSSGPTRGWQAPLFFFFFIIVLVVFSTNSTIAANMMYGTKSNIFTAQESQQKLETGHYPQRNIKKKKLLLCIGFFVIFIIMVCDATSCGSVGPE
jgi:hypothetical protein